MSRSQTQAECSPCLCWYSGLSPWQCKKRVWGENRSQIFQNHQELLGNWLHGFQWKMFLICRSIFQQLGPSFSPYHFFPPLIPLCDSLPRSFSCNFHDFCPFLSSLTPSFTTLSDFPRHPLFGFSFSSQLASANPDPQDSSPEKAFRFFGAGTKLLLQPCQPHLHKELNLKREFPPATI